MRRKRSLSVRPVRHQRLPLRAMLGAKRHDEVRYEFTLDSKFRRLILINGYHSFLLIWIQRNSKLIRLHPRPLCPHLRLIFPTIILGRHNLIVPLGNLNLQRKVSSSAWPSNILISDFKIFFSNAFRKAQAPPKGSCSVRDGETTRIWRIWRCLCREKKERQSTGKLSLLGVQRRDIIVTT